MSTARLELDFEDDLKRELPYFQVARIYVKMPSSVQGNSLTYITPDCASESEFVAHADNLIEELQEIKRRGQARFRAYSTK